jgi:hypothetical protein
MKVIQLAIALTSAAVVAAQTNTAACSSATAAIASCGVRYLHPSIPSPELKLTKRKGSLYHLRRFSSWLHIHRLRLPMF